MIEFSQWARDLADELRGTLEPEHYLPDAKATPGLEVPEGEDYLVKEYGLTREQSEQIRAQAPFMCAHELTARVEEARRKNLAEQGLEVLEGEEVKLKSGDTVLVKNSGLKGIPDGTYVLGEGVKGQGYKPQQGLKPFTFSEVSKAKISVMAEGEAKRFREVYVDSDGRIRPLDLVIALDAQGRPVEAKGTLEIVVNGDDKSIRYLCRYRDGDRLILPGDCTHSVPIGYQNAKKELDDWLLRAINSLRNCSSVRPANQNIVFMFDEHPKDLYIPLMSE